MILTLARVLLTVTSPESNRAAADGQSKACVAAAIPAVGIRRFLGRTEDMDKHLTNINPPNKNSSHEEVVITPAGPVSKDQVHPVGPGETIRRNPDGSYTVIRKKDQKDKEKEGENG